MGRGTCIYEQSLFTENWITRPKTQQFIKNNNANSQQKCTLSAVHMQAAQ